MSRSSVRFHLKQFIHEIYLMELKITEVPKDKKYKDGIKYSLIFMELGTKNRVLFDNHSPKGPHFHVDALEFDYDYSDDGTLIEDFKNMVFQRFGVKI